MSIVCAKPIFSKEDQIASLGNTWEEMSQNLRQDKVGFALSAEVAGVNEEDFLESIEKLREAIKNKLNSEDFYTAFNEIFKLNGKSSKDETSPNIEDAAIRAERKRLSQKLNTTLSKFFLNNLGAKDLRDQQFRQAMFNCVITNKDTKEIVDNDHTLNQNIENFKADEYKKLKKYLETQLGINGLAQFMYRDHRLVSNVDLAMQLFYNHVINDLYANNLKNLDRAVVTGWQAQIQGKNDVFWDALNAYINLQYIDELIEDSLGGYITSDSSLSEPIHKEIDSVGTTITYKYSFKSGNDKAVKDWTTKERDALAELGKFSNVLIESIPLISHTEAANKLNLNLNAQRLINAYIRLLEAIDNLPISDNNKITKLKELKGKLGTDTGTNLNEILNIIFNRDSETIRNWLKQTSNVEKGSNLSDFDLNVLASLHKTVFKDRNSYYNIEQKHLKNNGLSVKYPIVDTIMGVLNSVSSMNYLETKYNPNTERYETTVKVRYSDTSGKWNKVNHVNAEVIENDNKENLLNQYIIQFNRGGIDLTLTIGSNSYTFNGKGNSALGIFKRNNSDSNFSTEVNLSKFDDIKLEDYNTRDLIVNGDVKYLEFRNLLQFIDTMLKTSYSKSNESLNELQIMLQINPNALRHLFTAATRALAINKVLYDFEQSELTDLKDYLKSVNDLYGPKLGTLSASDFYGLFRQTPLGIEFETLKGSEGWLDDMNLAKAIVSGTVSKTTIKNVDGDSIPLYSPSYLGAKIQDYLNTQRQSKKASRHLLFARNPNSVTRTVIDTDVKTVTGESKSVKSMTQGELLEHAIINKFAVPIVQYGVSGAKIYIQPTTFSDKTKFVNYEVKTTYDGINILTATEDQLLDLYVNSIGNMYTDIKTAIIDKYSRIFETQFDNWQQIQTELNKFNLENKSRNIQDALIAKAYGRIDLKQDVDYRVINGKVYLNELAMLNIHADKEALRNRLYKEKLNFLNSLLNHRVKFGVSINEEETLGSDAVSQVMKRLIDHKSINKWHNKNRMYLAKVTNAEGTTRNISLGQKVQLSEGETLELNPVLEKYFYAQVLLGNNLRYSLSGTELNHKVKDLNKGKLNYGIAVQDKGLFELVNPSSDGSIPIINAALAAEYLKQSDSVKADEILNKVYDTLYEIEALAQGAQLKRNVIIPGTLRPYSQNTIRGIAPEMKFAVVSDLTAYVHNFDGDSSSIDAWDGSAWVDPFSSILENLSLQDNEVGKVKKPIWHHYDDETATATLVKYAADTITNDLMRKSERSRVSLRKLFKKMTNLEWKKNGNWIYGKVDLVEGCDFGNGKINFVKDILQGNELFYERGGKYYTILDFGRDGDVDSYNSVYYTEERRVDSLGNPTAEGVVKVYHYFDALGNHYKLIEPNETSSAQEIKAYNEKKQKLSSPLYHTVNSLYELHEVMGGIYSMSSQAGELRYSEASTHAVVNFMNNVATYKDTGDYAINQLNYHQPLKQALISYVASASAVKNGITNLNSTSVLYSNNEQPLRYFKISTKGHGIQLDADHTADEALMTEFSQVISSLASGGRLHDYVKEVYQVLGKVALNAANLEMEAVEEFEKTNNINKLYDILARMIINSHKEGKEGLADAIFNTIKKELNMNVDHLKDKIKVPFSDPNVYSNILSTFVGTINNKSVKRKYPGLGTVMAPGYDIVQVWDIGDKTYMFEDILKDVKKDSSLVKEALSELTKTGLDSFDTTSFNNILVQKFLESKQSNVVTQDVKYFKPGDIIDIMQYTGKDEEGNSIYTKIDDVNLDQINDYYNFKLNTDAFVREKLKEKSNGVMDFYFRRNTIKPRNLAPVQIDFTYIDSDTKQRVYTNIFDTELLINAFVKKTRNQNAIQEMFNNLAEGKYITPDGKVHEIVELNNKPAELVVSNMFKSRLGLTEFDTVNDVMDNWNGDIFKTKQLSKGPTHYDLSFTDKDGHNLYITFRNYKNGKNLDPLRKSQKDWKYTVLQDFNVGSKDNLNEPVVKYSKFATTKDNIKLFEVGRYITRPGYSLMDGNYYNKEGDEVSGKFKLDSNGVTVLEYVEFLTTNVIKETETDSDDEIVVNKFERYNLDLEKLKEVFVLDPKNEGTLEQQMNQYVGKILKDLYQSREFNGVTLNTRIPRNAAETLKHTLGIFATKLSYDKNLQKLVTDYHDVLQQVKEGEEGPFNIKRIKLNKIIRDYRNSIKVKKFSSFQKSLFFTASRIPAQTLQSFMQMKCVGYTGITTNTCYVSHWQTWLQGSDYDIDKAYLMGYSLDANGIYIGWSNMFNYDTLETLKASEELPMPTGRKYIYSEDGYDLSKVLENGVEVNYEQLYDQAEGAKKVLILAKVLKHLNNLSSLKLKVSDTTKDPNTDVVKSTNALYQAIKSHEATKLPQHLYLEGFKNFISSHIQNTVQNLKNTMLAYKPIDMEVFRDASKLSSKSNEVTGMTLLNPAVLYEMQYQNITGKNVIGIAANGEKASFMWNYYMNDMLLHGSDQDVKFASFIHVSKRISGRATNNIVASIVNVLPDVKLTEELKNRLIKANGDVYQLTGNLQVDLMISQILSAATDNAKELILAKVNAGNKLAKMYLYLVSLGYNINDIVSFMTCPVVDFIDKLSEENIFAKNSYSIKDAIKLARGIIPDNFDSWMSNEAKEEISNLIDKKTILDPNTNLPKIKYESYGSLQYEIMEYIAQVEELRQLRANFVNNSDYLEDIKEFEDILDGSDEFSSFGKILGLNQGLPTQEVDLKNLFDTFEKLITSREEKLKIFEKGQFNENNTVVSDQAYYDEVMGENFKFERFLQDKEYAKKTIEYYDKLKISINIFHILNNIPQYKALLKLIHGVNTFDSNLSVKTKIYRQIRKQAKDEGYFLSNDDQKKLVNHVDDLLIFKFLQDNVVTLPIVGNKKVYNAMSQEYVLPDIKKVIDGVEVSRGNKITLKDPTEIINFKKVFEDVIIPMLQNGEYWNGREIVKSPELRSNYFIDSLIRAKNGNVVFYKCDIDMMARNSSGITKINFEKLLKALYELKSIKFGSIAIGDEVVDMNLIDWFMLYNLIVHKNQYGSERMTALFTDYVDTYKGNNIIKRYLKHVGDLDYANEENILDFFITDALIATAKNVNSSKGRKEPVLLVNDPKVGAKYVHKKNFKYSDMDLTIVPEITGEELIDRQKRIKNKLKHSTLSFNQYAYIAQRKLDLDKLSDRTWNIINDFIRSGNVQIQNVCK